MRKVTTRYMLLLIGVSALALATGARPALAKKATVAAYVRAQVETTQPAHFYYAKHWKRGHRAARVSRRLIRPHGYAVYRRSGHPRLPNRYETDLLLDCLFAQPFVICP
jgi:hypothetical protein